MLTILTVLRVYQKIKMVKFGLLLMQRYLNMMVNIFDKENLNLKVNKR
jgi:hypothetical protein